MKSLLQSALQERAPDESYSQEARYEFPYEELEVETAWEQLSSSLKRLYGITPNDGVDESDLDKLAETLGTSIPLTLRQSLMAHAGVERPVYVGSPYFHIQQAYQGDHDDGLIQEAHKGKLTDSKTKKRANRQVRDKLREQSVSPAFLANAEIFDLDQIQAAYEQLRELDDEGTLTWRSDWIPFAGYDEQEYLFLDPDEQVRWLDTREGDEDPRVIIENYTQWLTWAYHSLEISIEVLSDYTN